jgi:hypothetical protein
MPPQSKPNGWAISSLVCGILGCIPFITGVLAIIFGIVGIKKSSDPQRGGRGLAIAGLVLGLVSIVLWGLFGSGIYALMSGTGPARDQARAFITDLSKADVASAQSRCTKKVDRDEIQRVADHMKDWGALKGMTILGVNMSASTGQQTKTQVSGSVEFDNLRKGFMATLVKEAEQWKIDSFSFEGG